MCQLSPASVLLNKSEFIAPARTILESEGSTATLVAVPPNGPAIFQSPTVSAALAGLIAVATKPAASANV